LVWNGGYAPFNWSEVSSTSTNYPIANSAGSYADGYDVQIAIKIANALDRELVIQKVDWEGLIPAVQSEVSILSLLVVRY
jgi:putative lysine transport system permease protein